MMGRALVMMVPSREDNKAVKAKAATIAQNVKEPVGVVVPVSAGFSSDAVVVLPAVESLFSTSGGPLDESGPDMLDWWAVTTAMENGCLGVDC